MTWHPTGESPSLIEVRMPRSFSHVAREDEPFRRFNPLSGQSSVAVTYAVTVASKDSTHRYNGQGSGNAYVIDNLQAPVITVTPGRTYRFTNDNTGSHPLKFYYQADRTTLYTTGVTFDNSYTEITITDTTPAVLHYQCTNHQLMGNAIITQSNPIVGAGITLNADGGGVHVTGIVTATTFSGNLTGNVTGDVNAATFDSGVGGVVVTGVTTTTSINSTDYEGNFELDVFLFG